MDTLQLNAIATRLLLDEEFEADLIHLRRFDCLADFALSDSERSVILAIPAQTPQQFLNELRKLVPVNGPPPRVRAQRNYQPLFTLSSSPARGTQSF